MANCINCGAKLNALNETYPLWESTDDRFCSRCREKAKRFFKRHEMDFGNRKITTSLISSNIETLLGMGFSESGIRYLLDYAAALNESSIAENTSAELSQSETVQKHQEAWNNALERNNRTEEQLSNIYYLKATTGYNFEGYEIRDYIAIFSAEVVLGKEAFSEFSEGVSDTYEILGNAGVIKLTMAKASALRKLKEKCYDAGANAVIGVTIDMTTIGQNMMIVSADGTAVKISKTKL